MYLIFGKKYLSKFHSNPTKSGTPLVYNIGILSTWKVTKLLGILILILLAELFATYTLFFFWTRYPAKSASYVQLLAACELFSTNEHFTALHLTFCLLNEKRSLLHSKSLFAQVELWLKYTFNFIFMGVLCLVGITFNFQEIFPPPPENFMYIIC